MEKKVINYETMLKVGKAISHSKDPEEVALMCSIGKQMNWSWPLPSG
jgi:hypothetical protein